MPTEVELAVTPARLSTTDRLQDKRRWGWAVQLYSVASNRTWGVGDLNDLAGLAAIGGEPAQQHEAGAVLQPVRRVPQHRAELRQGRVLRPLRARAAQRRNGGQ